jgi:membrane-associated protease RseP (regulator of RpoE activity)
VRATDPLEDLNVGQRKAILITACLVLLAVAAALIQPTITALVFMILAFFVMIMLHEFGHFIVAKRSGMKVTEFFVGFGPRIWSVQKGETEYGVKALPLGGYCKIIGMTNLDEVAPEDEPRAYRSKPWHSKVATAAAGPAVHFIIAIVLMFVVIFGAGDLRHSALTTKLSEVTAGAKAAGLQKGDEIIAINGTHLDNWNQVRPLISPANNPAKAGQTVTIVVRRGEQVFERNVVLGQSDPKDGPVRIVAGIAPQQYVPHPGVIGSAVKAPGEVVAVSGDALGALGKMFSPSGLTNYFKILSGDKSKSVDQNQRFVSPVGYGNLAYSAIQAGWVDVLGLLIVINIFVGILNLMPLLPFDGGHIAVATYEKVMSRVRRKKVTVDVAKLMPITAAVLAIVVFIGISSLYLDITNPIKSPF